MLDTNKILEQAAKLKASGTAFALVTVVRCESPTSAKPGAKAIVEADGKIQGWIGGGCAQPTVIKMSKLAILDGQSRLIRISPGNENSDNTTEHGIIDFSMNCFSGGSLEIFIDPIIQRPGLLIIGASPVAQALSGFAQHAGFSVTAAFPGIDTKLFPEADFVINNLDSTVINSRVHQFVLVSTQGKSDESGLEAALSTTSDYIAFVASDRKATKLRKYLKECGHDSDKVDAILSPAGIDIGAVTPEEIALSILAGIIKTLRTNNKTTRLMPEKNTIKNKLNPLTITTNSCCTNNTKNRIENKLEAIDPICGMAIEIENAELTTEYQSNTYYFCCDGCLHRFTQAPEKYLA